MRFELTKVLAAALLLTSCRSAPELEGHPLGACSEDADCPAGLRCLRDRCLANSLPSVRLEPTDVLRVVLGGSAEVRAVAEDADGDVLSYSWLQRSPAAPALVTAPLDAATLSITADRVELLGDYAFDLAVSDGYGAVSARLNVIVYDTLPTVATDTAPRSIAPGTSVTLAANPADADGHPVTVSWRRVSGPAVDLGAASGDELTITPNELGVLVVEAVPNDGWQDGTPGQFVLIVQPGGAVYVSAAGADGAACGSIEAPCASIGGAAAVAPSGGELFVAARFDGSEYTECIDITGDLRVRGGYDPVTWVATPARRVFTVVRCGGAASHHVGGSAALADLTLSATSEARTDGSRATLHVEGAPRLEDLDILTADCGVSCSAIGVMTTHGSPLLSGVEISAERSGFPVLGSFVGHFVFGGAPRIETSATGRGRVVLDVPTTTYAAGVLLARSAAVVDGIVVRLRLGEILTGIAVLGGDVGISRADVRVSSFGTLALYGISATACSDAGWPCLDPDLTAPPSPATVHQPVVRIDDSRVTVEGAQAGQPPCIAIGAWLASELPGMQVTRSTIELVHDAHVAIGSFLQAGAGGGPTHANVFAENDVTVDGGVVNAVCRQMDLEGLDGNESAVGFNAAAADLLLEGNTIRVGPHESTSIGLALYTSDASTVRDNDIELGSVGGQSVALAGEAVAAVLLTEASASAPASFSRNRVSAGDAVAHSTGLYVAGGAYWSLTNNFIHGGLARHTLGLGLLTSPADGMFPLVAHNTLAAGGDAARSLTSTALYRAAALGGAAGALLNNLIDGGEAMGRRRLVGLDPSADFATWRGNVAQIADAPAGPEPIIAQGGDAIRLLLGRSGEWIHLSGATSGAPRRELSSMELPGRATAAWSGTFQYAPVVTAVLAGDVMELSSGGYRLHSTAGFGPQAGCQAGAPAMADADLDGVADILLIEDCSAAATDNRLWLMRGIDGTRYEAPLLWELPPSPAVITSTAAGTLLIASGAVVHVFAGRLKEGPSWQIDLSPQLAAPIEALEPFSTAAANDASAAGLLIRAGTRLFAANGVGADAGSFALLAFKDELGSVIEPCAGDTVVAASGELSSAEIDIEVAAICGSGALEVYTYDSSQAVMRRIAIGMGAEGASAAAIPAGGCSPCELHVVTRAKEAVPHLVAFGVAGASVELREVVELTSSIAMPHPTADMSSYSETFVGTAASGVNHQSGGVTLCPLRARGRAPDLHLDAAGSCADAAADLADLALSADVTAELGLDIDGRQRAGTADVGADELGN